jgi:hypothetical protein
MLLIFAIDLGLSILVRYVRKRSYCRSWSWLRLDALNSTAFQNLIRNHHRRRQRHKDAPESMIEYRQNLIFDIQPNRRKRMTDALFKPIFINNGAPITLPPQTSITDHLKHLIQTKQISPSLTFYHSTSPLSAYTLACATHQRSLLIHQLELGELTGREIEAHQRDHIDILHTYNE